MPPLLLVKSDSAPVPSLSPATSATVRLSMKAKRCLPCTFVCSMCDTSNSDACFLQDERVFVGLRVKHLHNKLSCEPRVKMRRCNTKVLVLNRHRPTSERHHLPSLCHVKVMQTRLLQILHIQIRFVTVLYNSSWNH